MRNNAQLGHSMGLSAAVVIRSRRSIEIDSEQPKAIQTWGIEHLITMEDTFMPGSERTWKSRRTKPAVR